MAQEKNFRARDPELKRDGATSYLGHFAEQRFLNAGHNTDRLDEDLERDRRIVEEAQRRERERRERERRERERREREQEGAEESRAAVFSRGLRRRLGRRD